MPRGKQGGGPAAEPYRQLSAMTQRPQVLNSAAAPQSNMRANPPIAGDWLPGPLGGGDSGGGGTDAGGPE